MSSRKYAAPLRLEITTSKKIIALLIFLHGASLGILFLLPLNSWLIAVVSVLIVVSGIYTIADHGLKILSSSFVELLWDNNDEWFITLKDETKIAVTFLPNSFIHPWITILNFKQSGKLFSRSIILVSDNVSREDFRRLRVRLKVTSLQGEVA